jgi:two-component system sensor histidine kinase ChvG
MKWSAIRGWRPSRIGLRLLAFNLLVVFVPVLGVLYLSVYETRLLQAQEQSMVQQGRVLAAALAEQAALDAASIDRLFTRLGSQGDARYRVFDSGGALLADSARNRPPAPSEEKYGASEPQDVRQRVLYRLGALIANSRKKVKSWAGSPSPDARPLDAAAAPEVHAALAGRYGSATRQTPGQRSVTMFSALPVARDGTVVGAVLVSQSTYRILRALYDVRLRIFEIVIASLIAASLLTAVASMTIVGPLTRLRSQALAIAERGAPLPVGFPGAARVDELGDLARALDELTRRVHEHVRLVQSFAADVSHEFRNPLASIRTAGEMMVVADAQPERQRFLDLLVRDVGRLERLVSGLREVAVVGEQLQQAPTESIDLAELMKELAGRFELSGGRRVMVVVKTPAGSTVVRGSRERLDQVFDNVIGNGVSFSPDGGVVEVTLTLEGRACIVGVLDRGPGIPSAHLDRVFDRFFSYRPATERGNHIGLGLAIARQIVEGYGGTISATNRPGGGARFEVSLPLASVQT